MGGLSFPSLDQAIGVAEGYGTPGSIATRQNNPGDLIYNSYTQSLGATGAGAGGIAIFPDAQTGLSAEDRVVSQYAANNPNFTLSDLANSWVPPNAPGNTAQSPVDWANNISSVLGLGSSNPSLSSLQGQITPGSQATPTGLPSLPSLPSLGDWGGILGGAVQNAIPGSAALSPSTLLGLPFGRIAAFGVGLIFIVGGLFMLKPGLVINAGKKAAEVAAV